MALPNTDSDQEVVSFAARGVKSNRGEFRFAKHMPGDFTRVFDAFIIVIWSVLSYAIYAAPQRVVAADFIPHAAYGIVAALVSALIFNLADIYSFDNLRRSRWQIFWISVTWSFVVMIGLAAAFLTKTSEGISRGWFLIWFAGTLVTMAMARVAISQVLNSGLKEGKFSRNIVIVGDDYATRLLPTLGQDETSPINVVGLFTDLPMALPPTRYRHMQCGAIDEMDTFIRSVPVDEIIIALSPAHIGRVDALVERLSSIPADLNLVIENPLKMRRFTRVHQHGDVLLGTIVERPLKHWRAVQKRALNVAVALPVLIVASPLMALIALAVKLDSKGPVLFRQDRYGYNNRAVRVMKFRTMRITETDLSGARHTIPNDPRVTRIGRFLRSSSLDELPQLFNVLTGDMSLVGPRPHVMAMRAGDQLYDEAVSRYFNRHRVRPGMTGWAQVHGLRGEIDGVESARARVAYDLYYIDHWSVRLDLKIMLMTLGLLVKRTNAY